MSDDVDPVEYFFVVEHVLRSASSSSSSGASSSSSSPLVPLSSEVASALAEYRMAATNRSSSSASATATTQKKPTATVSKTSSLDLEKLKSKRAALDHILDLLELKSTVDELIENRMQQLKLSIAQGVSGGANAAKARGFIAEQMQEVVEGLFIGSAKAAAHEPSIMRFGITHVLVCCDINTKPFADSLGVEYKVMDALLDSKEQELQGFLDDSYDFIDAALSSCRSASSSTGQNDDDDDTPEQGGRQRKVLVHCAGGISRSPAIVVGYLIRKLNISFDAAHAMVLRVRPCVSINEGFVAQLKGYSSRVAAEAAVSSSSQRPGKR